jgi:hypothetical protein
MMTAMAVPIQHYRVFVAYLDTMQTTVEGSQRIRVPTRPDAQPVDRTRGICSA